MKSFSVWQIYYDSLSEASLDKGFLSYDNSSYKGDFYENSVINNIYRYYNHQWVNSDYVGVLSWKFWNKTGLTSEQIFDVIGKKKEGKDVYLFTPPARMKNKSLLSSESELHIADIAKIIDEHNILPCKIYDYDSSPIISYSNFWIAKPEVFHDYCKHWLVPVMDLFLESHDLYLKKLLLQPIRHNKKDYPPHPFFLEMLFSVFVKENGYTFDYVMDNKKVMEVNEIIPAPLKKKAEQQYTPVKKNIQSSELKPRQKTSIVGFYHVCMINNFLNIVHEQMDVLHSSELYREVKKLYVGCVGSIENYERLREYLTDMSSMPVEIIFYSDNLNLYEFPTLDFLKRYCDNLTEEEFLFYFHTKGVSNPDKEGGIHWRQYMNHFNLQMWEWSLSKLLLGYDTCGVKYIPKGNFKAHYSGNFWWAASEYIKTLDVIETLNTKDRFAAEMWLCSKEPKVACLSNRFVDYNTKGKFIVPKYCTIVHTLAFNLSSEVSKATEDLYDQNKEFEFTHVIVDLGYPLTEGDVLPENIERNKIHNTSLNLDIAMQFGSEFLAVKNVGVSQNWELVRKQYKITDEEVLICADPDERPLDNGWVKAVRDVLIYGDNIAWCSLLMEEQLPLLKDEPIHTIAGIRVYIPQKGFAWAQGGFSGKFLNEIGGVPVPEGAPVYGWIETACQKKMDMLGYRMAILADYRVKHTDDVPLYREWKTHITSNVKDGQISFEQWLKDKKNEGIHNHVQPADMAETTGNATGSGGL